MPNTKEKWQEIANRGLQDNFDPETRAKFDEAVNRGLIKIETQEGPQDLGIDKTKVDRYKRLLMQKAQGVEGLEPEISSLFTDLSAQQETRSERGIPQPTKEDIKKVEDQKSFGGVLARTPLTAAESAATLGTAVIAEPVAGVSGILAGLNPFGSEGDSVKAIEYVNSLSYKPDSPEAKAVNKAFADKLAPVGEAMQSTEEFLGEGVLELTGSPALAATAKAIPTAVIEGLGLKGVSKIRGAKKITGITDDVAKNLESQGINIDDLSDANIAQIKEKSKAYYDDQLERIKSFEEEGVTRTKGDITQTLEQQKVEAQLLESTGEAGDSMRQTRLNQSRELKQNIESMVDDLGIPDDIIDSVKDALTSRKKDLKVNRKELYKVLAEETKTLNIPLVTEGIVEAVSDMRKMRDLKTMSPGASKAIDDVLKDYGIIDGGTDVTPLSLENFESMRKSLNNIEKADFNAGIITGDIKKAIDDAVTELSDALVKDGNANISEMAKEARKSHIALMNEFDAKTMTGMLIDNKKRSIVPKIEGSVVYQKLSSKSTPIEQFSKVVDSLKKSGNSGVKALSDLKSRIILDVVDTAFSAGGRKIGGERTFGSAAFQKKIKDLRPKLEKLFDKAEMKKFDNMVKISESIRPQSAAVPKGSAGYLMDVFNTLGLQTMMSKVPFSGALINEMSKMSRSAKNKKAFSNAMKDPKFKQSVDLIVQDYPSLAVVLGVSQINQKDNNNE